MAAAAAQMRELVLHLEQDSKHSICPQAAPQSHSSRSGIACASIHMEEVKKFKKQRGSFTECLENQSSLFEASVLKYHKLPRML